MHRNYLAFFNINDTDTSSQALRVSQHVKVSWSDPSTLKNPENDKSLNPLEWNSMVIPQLFDVLAYWNMTIHLSRLNTDKQKIEANVRISLEMISATMLVWIILMNSEIPSKGLINTINMVYNRNISID